MPLTNKDIQVLSAKYGWYQAQLDFGTAEWVLDNGRRELAFNKIRKDRPFLIIKCFLGSFIKNG